MSDDWTEKYRPATLKDVIGNPSAVNELLSWARSWESGIPSKRAVILMGSPGIGKTSSAQALAADMGWDIVEMNASDQRTGDAIRDVAVRGSQFNTFNEDGTYKDAKKGEKKLIVLDEADNLFGNADRGAMPVINELIKTTKQPVILIVNDFYELSRKSATVKTDTIQISFRKPTVRSVVTALSAIAKKENVSVDAMTLAKIAENADGDMRAAVRNLESLALGTDTIKIESAEQLGERNVTKDMYSVLDAVFRRNDPSGARIALSKTDTDPQTALLWMDENLPYEYRDPGDLVRGYEKLSRADIYLGRVIRRQHYGFWSYASEMMTMGLSVARMNSAVSRERLKFPSYLTKMSRSKGVRSAKASVCYKLAVLNHTSTKRTDRDILPAMQALAENSEEFRAWLVRTAGLEAEELGFILGAKIDSPIVKKAMAAAEASKTAESAVKTKVVEEPAAEPEENPAPVITVAPKVQEPVQPPKQQRNLFDFG